MAARKKPSFPLVAERTDVTQMEFHLLEHHPKALRAECKKNGGVTTHEFIVRKAAIEKILSKGQNPVDHFYPNELDLSAPRSTIPLTAQFWPVTQADLAKVQYLEKGLDGRNGHDLFECRVPLEDPNGILIYKSGYDHQVWGIDGKRIFVPVWCELGGSNFDLKAVAEHLKGRPEVLSFTIRGGRADLVIDPGEIPNLPMEAVTKTWFEHHVCIPAYGAQFNYLDLHKFYRPEDSEEYEPEEDY